MNDTATVFLTLGPALIAGAVGYAAARLQAATSQRQLQAETARLRLTQSDAARERRQSVYEEFTALMYRLDTIMTGFSAAGLDEFRSWIVEFQQLHSRLDLIASEPVRHAIEAVRGQIDAIGRESQRRSGIAGLESRFATSYRANREDIISAVEHAVAEMRRDVAPRE